MGSTLFFFDTNMKEFTYLNLHTVYKCTGNYINEETGSDGDCCFRKIFHYRSGLNGKDDVKENYVITTYKGLWKTANNEGNKNNLCLFSKEEIEKHLNFVVSNIFPFKYKVDEIEKSCDKHIYNINLDIEGNFLYHKFILTWTRYLYEFPTCMLMKDAYRLAKCPEFKFINIFDLYNIVSGCYSKDNYKTDQTLSRGGKMMSYRELRARLLELEPSGGNSNILSKIYNGRHTYIENLLEFSYKKEYNDIEYWESPSEFEYRKSKYLNELKRRKHA